MAAYIQNIPDPVHVDTDGQFQFLVESHGGRCVEDNVDVADQGLAIGQGESQPRQGAVARHWHNLVTELWHFGTELIENLRGRVDFPVSFSN